MFGWVISSRETEGLGKPFEGISKKVEKRKTMQNWMNCFLLIGRDDVVDSSANNNSIELRKKIISAGVE